MPRRRSPTLILIGGHEDREGDKVILREVAARIGSGKLVVSTVASQDPGDLFDQYERAFRSLGVRHLYRLDVDSREDATTDRAVRILDDADGIFFTGGDQLKITSQLGDTPVFTRINEVFQGGGLIAGTSAGASVVCETMLVRGEGNGSHKLGSLQMAPGLGLIRDVIVDQHFAERGRVGRLIGAVAQNPRALGLGIDENTAVVIERKRMRVVGEGAVYVVDGRPVTYSNLADEQTDRPLSIFDVRLHILSMSDVFDLGERRPEARPADEALEELGLDPEEVEVGHGDE